MRTAQTARYMVFIILGIAILVVKPVYSGPGEDIVYAYAGNASVSFALYFLALIAFARRGITDGGLARAFAAGLVLIVVEFFEIADGFGFMDNTYDTFDLLANAIGIGLAVLVDMATVRFVPAAPPEGDDEAEGEST